MEMPKGATHKKTMGIGVVYFRRQEINDVFGKKFTWDFYDKYTGEWKPCFYSPSPALKV